MKLCKRILKTTLLALIMLVLVSGTVLAAYSYYATVQVQETGGVNSYDYLPVIADIDNDYLADNGYISITGLDTRILSGSTPLEHLVTDDKVLFVEPTVAASGTGNYRYTLGNTEDLDDFPVIVGYDTGANGFITITDDDTLDGGAGGMDTFEIEQKGWVNTDAGDDKNLVYKADAFRTYISAEDEITSVLMTDGAFPTVAATDGGNNAVNGQNHSIDLPAGVVSGNLLLVFFVSDGVPTITFPVGWINLFEKAGGVDVKGGAWYKVAGVGEDDPFVVTTDADQMTAYTIYRITDYAGVPEAGVATTGDSVSPDPPSLTPSWSIRETLWFAIAGYDAGARTITDYPANYGNGRSDRSNDAEGAGVGSARRELEAASEDPGVFTLSVAEVWIANTIAISPDWRVVSATGITSGVRRVVTTAVAAGNLTISVYDEDDNLIDDGTTPMGGASVPPNVSDWLLMQNNVMPYMEYYKHTVDGTLIAWYQPISMIIDTNLDDRAGTDVGEDGDDNDIEEDAIITWGANPVGIDVAIGSLVSSSQPPITPASEEEAVDIVPEGEVPIEGGVVNTTNLQDNPLYPIVHVINEYTDYTEEQIWFMGATLIILLCMGIAVVRVPNHLLLAGTVGLVLGGFFTAMEIYQWWMMLVMGFIFVMSILMERKPVL